MLLLYNQRKEFIGIDEDDLKTLDFQNINELQNESQDFADLFVKKPGYIHNFKNFSWIDFILHSEADESKAIIHAKGRNYSCVLHITPFYFTADESGYAVIIRNLRALKGAEDAQAKKDLESSGGLQTSPAAKPAHVPSSSAQASNDPAPELDISLDDIKLNAPEETPSFPEPEPELELPSFETSSQQELSEPEPLDIPDPLDVEDLSMPPADDYLATENEFGAPVENEFGAPSDIDFNAPLDLGDDLMHDEIVEDDVVEPEIEEPEAVSKNETPMLGDYVSGEDSEHLSDLVNSGTYQYDPNVAADELGLPVDLIEEFIGDFIDQAYEFKDDLFASVNASDFDNVQVLSHKLKGVAANLRVEDAFDVLSVVNTSKDIQEILPNLTEFYKIIAKLDGKEVPEEVPQAPEPITSQPEAPVAQIEDSPVIDEEDNYDIGIKQPEEGPMLIDEEVHSHENDDLYDDLLGAPTEFIESSEAPLETQEESDDLYDDLLGAPSFEEPAAAPTPSMESNEDLYDDLLGTPDDSPQESDPASKVEASPINFDAQSSANQLGIPVEIVKEFVQEFKEQVNSHQIDFTNALNEQNIKEVNNTATLLKGMSDNLRLNEISEVLKELQSETNINNTADAIAKLQAYADQL